jgi:hypothetical protein
MTGIRLTGTIDRTGRALFRDIAELPAVLAHLGFRLERGLHWCRTVVAKALHVRHLAWTALWARSLES